MRTACVLALMAACASTARPPASPSPATSTRQAEPPASAAEAAGDGGLPGQGHACDRGRCAPGLTCLSYFGIAGMRGPSFTSCEIPCSDLGTQCPQGQACVTIADGPGRVCRLAR